MKRNLIIFYLVIFTAMILVGLFDDIKRQAPLWFMILDIMIPGLVALSIAFYALDFRPKRGAWVWKVVPPMFVIFELGDMFRTGAFILVPLLSIALWLLLFPAVYLSFRFGFPSERRKWLPLRIYIGISALFCLVFIVTPLFETPPPRTPKYYNSIANHDLRNATTAQEAFFVDNQRYASLIEALVGPSYGLYLYEGVEIYVISADEDRYRMVAFHEKGDKATLVLGPGGTIEMIPKADAVLMTESIREAFKAKVEGLIDDLKSNDSKSQAHAVEALRKIENKRAVEPLIEALRDRDSVVRSRAAAALGSIPDERSIEALIQILLCDESEGVRIVASRSLVRIRNERVFDSLIEAIKQNDAKYLREAISVLKSIGDPRAIELLIQLIRKDSDRRVQEAAVVALGSFDGRSILEPLIEALKHKNYWVREKAAFALGELKEERAVEPLITLLKNDGYRSVLVAAARALGKIGDPRAVEPLKTVLANAEKKSVWRQNVRKATSEALKQLTGEVFDEEDLREYVWTPSERMFLVDSLISALKDEETRVRLNTIQKLKALKDKRAVVPLAEALKDEDKDVRINVTKALLELKNGRALIPLTIALQDADKDVRKSASRAIDYLLSRASPRPTKQDKLAITSPLVIALKDEDKSVRQHAAIALGKLKDRRAVEVLMSALKDPNSNIRANSAFYLGEIGDQRAFKPLVQVLGDEFKHLVGHALGALAKIDSNRSVPYLIEALKDENESVRTSAVIILGKLADERAVEPLREVLKKDSSKKIRDYAAKALEKMR